MNKIHLSVAAQNDLQDIKQYIAIDLENKNAAVNTLKRIINKIKILKEHAMAGASITTIAEVDSEYRFLVAGNYLVFYRVKAQNIYVDRILYGRRNYLKILLSNTENNQPENIKKKPPLGKSSGF